MLPHELADDLCSLRPHVERLTVTVEIPPQGAAVLLPLRDPLGRAPHLRPGGAARGRPAILDQLELNDALARELRTDALRARRAPGRDARDRIRASQDGRVSDAWLEGEPHAHMLVEELMIRANEHVAELLAGRNREALYRVHERPDPQAVELLLAKLADARRPDAAGAGAAFAAGEPRRSPARPPSASPTTPRRRGGGGRRSRRSSSAR